LIFIKKGGEIRLCETLATNPAKIKMQDDGLRCQNLIPIVREMIKINTETNENILTGQGKTSDAAHAYVHALVKSIQEYLPDSFNQTF